MKETTQQYTQRILDYSAGKDPLRLQQAAPKKLASMIKGKNKKLLARRPAPGKWSVAEILAHLADAEIVVGWRLRQILSTNGVAIQGFNEESWATTFDYAHRDPRQSLQTYRALRELNLALLRTVSKSLWSNYGVHSERGNESAEHIVRLIAGHDLNHLEQIEKIVKARSSR